jgi:sugar phosphate isomerase/epimerase
VGKIDISADFEPHFEEFKNAVALAKLFGSRYIRIFSFFLPKGDDAAVHRDEVLRRLDRLLNYAARQEVVLLHENEKHIYGDTALRCRDILEHFSSPGFRAVFDFANFIQCGQDTREAYGLLRPYVDYIHIKDAVKEDGSVVPAGMGDGQVAPLLACFQESGYKGFLSLEPHLAKFAGFASAEKTWADGVFAFSLAAQALKAILWDIDWR